MANENGLSGNTFRPRILAVRQEAAPAVTGVGLELNTFAGFTKVRYLEPGPNDWFLRFLEEPDFQDGPSVVELPAAEHVECVPTWWCTQIGRFDPHRLPDGFDVERPEGLFRVDLAKVEEAERRLLRREPSAEPGTLEYAYRASSPRPATKFDFSLFEIRVSEMHAAGHTPEPFLGLFVQRALPANYVVGEYLGKTYPADALPVANEESKYLYSVFDKPSHDRRGRRLRVAPETLRRVAYIDADEIEHASFLRYVNAPSLNPDDFTDEENAFLGLTTDLFFNDRPGVPNCTFWQVEQRVFLVTTCEVPEGKELLASYGDDYPLPDLRRRIILAEAERFAARGMERPPLPSLPPPAKRAKRG